MPHFVLQNAAPPYHKQAEILREIFTPDAGRVKQIDLCCGRGFGKTFFSIIVALKALTLGSDIRGLFLEPDWAKVRSVFLSTWRELVPHDIWTLNKGEQTITMAWGAVLHYGPRNVSGSKEDMRDKYRGGNLHFVVDDEAAIGCDSQQYTNTLAAIRRQGDVRFYLTISTPKVGDYSRLIHSPKHSVYKGTSLDNPYLPSDYVPNLIANMSPDQVRREIYAEEISLEGRIWKTWKDEPWPAGNIHDAWKGFRRNSPWWLFCDLGGATGSYAVVQRATPSYHGRRDIGDIWTAVADLCPQADASASRAFGILKENFGTPAAVVAGADVNTRGAADGKTVSYFAKKHWGNVRVFPVSEGNADKQIQYDLLSYLICDATGNRRFCISKDFVSLDLNSHRGIREMIKEDEWPDESKVRPGDVLPKHKTNRVQHIRDALLMGAYASMQPPRWGKSNIVAA